METTSDLSRLIRQRIVELQDPHTQLFVKQLRQNHNHEIAAILFYGSCLFQQTRTYSSFHDFYLLTDHLRKYHRSLKHSALNLVLPPNVYYKVFTKDEDPAISQTLRCKVCVLSLAQYRAESSSQAHDIHHLGRFSKRFALVYSRDEHTTQTVVAGAISAMLSLVPYSLSLLPRHFSLEEFILKQLSLSYLGEQRVAEPQKVQKLFEASESYYQEVYPQVLALYANSYGYPTLESKDSYSQLQPTPIAVEQTHDFLKRSRYRGVLRWPKYMFTVDNWLEYILTKLERHQGIKLELTERERRYPLIFGWPKFFALKRRGIVK